MPYRHKPSPHIGQKFGRLTLLREVHIPAEHPRWDWVCRCECGNEVVARQRSVKSGHTKSCGCYHKDVQAARLHRHGLARSYLYVAWHGMLQRCQNPKSTSYPGYGGRGIAVCERWQVFENFVQDMGGRPSPRHSVDRRNNDLGYSPDNCRWATPKQQQNNTRWSIRRRLKDAVKGMRIMDQSLNPSNVRAHLHSRRIRAAGDLPTSARLTILLDGLDTMEKPECWEGQHVHQKAVMARAARELMFPTNAGLLAPPLRLLPPPQ